jgi:hypothetical protein
LVRPSRRRPCTRGFPFFLAPRAVAMGFNFRDTTELDNRGFLQVQVINRERECREVYKQLCVWMGPVVGGLTDWWLRYLQESNFDGVWSGSCLTGVRESPMHHYEIPYSSWKKKMMNQIKSGLPRPHRLPLAKNQEWTHSRVSKSSTYQLRVSVFKFVWRVDLTLSVPYKNYDINKIYMKNNLSRSSHLALLI